MSTPIRPHKGAPPAQTALTDGTLTAAVAAPGAGKHIVVRGFVGSNSGASLTVLDIKDDSTTKFTFAMGANGGGFCICLPQEWHLTSNKALKVQQSASVNSYFTPMWDVVPD